MKKQNKKVALKFATFAALFGVMSFFMDMMEENEEQTTYSVTLESLALGNGETDGENGGGGTDGEDGGGTGTSSDACYEKKNTRCTATTTTTWTTWGTVSGDLGASSLSSLLAKLNISASAAVKYTHTKTVNTIGFKRHCLVGGFDDCTPFDCTA